ncbi:MAG: hypothetical protein V2A62_01520 [Candidatus Woesearchaeota archaeon]
MKAFVIVNSGLESLAQQEIQELVGAKGKIFPGLVLFEVKKKEELLKLMAFGQSFKRIALLIDQQKEVEKFNLDKSSLEWKEFFTAELSLKITVEQVKGNDNRLVISRQVMGKLFKFIEAKLKFTPKIELKKPDAEIIVVKAGEEFFLGLDLCGKELNARGYRVFPNQASFKGDLGYYFLRKSGFKAGEKLLIGYVKDGTLAIEAALLANKIIVNYNLNFSWYKFMGCKEVELKYEKVDPTLVYGFDESMQNIIAAKKNASIGKVRDLVQLSRYALDELELKYEAGEFDRIIVQITTKDEEKLNEIFYQVTPLLKSGGGLLLITRKGLDLSTPSKFKLVLEEEMQRGESYYKLWRMEKK